MVLARKRWSGEVSQIESFHLGGVNIPIFQALIAGLDGQGAQIPIGKRAKPCFSDSNHGDRSHIINLRAGSGGKTRLHVFEPDASSRCTSMRSVMPARAIEVADPVSETFESGVAESLERQNRFVADNLRRIFVQIYRIVRNESRCAGS